MNKKSIKFCIIFSFFYVLPLLISNIYYTDDILRSVQGYGWDQDGRFLSTYIMQFITSGRNSLYSTDLFPYSILLSSLILSLSGYCISYIIKIEENQKIKFSAALLLISPFMLENLSYRWDSLPMAISIWSVIFPYIFHSKLKFILASIIGILITIFTYQASIVIYILMAMITSISYSINNKTQYIYSLIKKSILSLLISFILFKIYTWFSPINFQNRDETIFFENFLPLLTKNMISTLKTVKLAFNTSFIICFFILITFCSMGIIKCLLYATSKTNKIIMICFLFLIPLIIPIIILIQKEPWIVPRVLVGFPFLLYSMLIFVNKISSKIVSYISIFFILISLPLMATYANALKSQQEYEKFIVLNIANRVDLNDKEIVFDGKSRAPELEVANKNYPIIELLVPSYIKNDWFWEEFFFKKNTHFLYFPNFPNGKKRDLIINNKFSIPIIHKTNSYFIRTSNKTIIVDFNKSIEK